MYNRRLTKHIFRKKYRTTDDIDYGMIVVEQNMDIKSFGFRHDHKRGDLVLIDLIPYIGNQFYHQESHRQRNSCIAPLYSAKIIVYLDAVIVSDEFLN